MKISIIIFNYNGGARLENCLHAVQALRMPEGAEAERILVDVDSGSGLAKRLKLQDPALRLLDCPVRMGLAESMNQAARKASGRYLAMLQHHVVLHPGWLLACYRALETVGLAKPPACAFSRLQKDMAEGTLWEARTGGSVKPYLHPASGAFLVERDAFFDCGEFDGEYYLAEECVDLGMRLWQRGRSVVGVDGDLARVSGTGIQNLYGRAEQLFFTTRNRLLTVVKNYEMENVYRFLPPLLAAILRRVRHSGDHSGERYEFSNTGKSRESFESRLSAEAAAGLLALDDVISQFERVRSRRERVQLARSVTDKEIYGLVDHPYDSDRQLEIAEQDGPLFRRLRNLMNSLLDQDAERGMP